MYCKIAIEIREENCYLKFSLFYGFIDGKNFLEDYCH